MRAISINGTVSEKGCEVSCEDQPAAIGQNQGDERALIYAAQQGDLEAFNRLVIANQDRVYTQAFYLLGDRMAAEDAVQDAFIAAYESFQSYRGGSFRGWLIRIVTNKCLDELRGRKRHIETGFDAIDVWGDEIESPPWSIDTGETPEERLIRAEIGHYLLLSLDRLNAEYRTALVLVDILEMHYSEAAEVLDCPIGTIKSRLTRARLQMQHLLRAGRELT